MDYCNPWISKIIKGVSQTLTNHNFICAKTQQFTHSLRMDLGGVPAYLPALLKLKNKNCGYV